MSNQSLTEYMVQQATDFNNRCDVIEQKVNTVSEKIGVMEYNIDRLVNQLEVLIDKLPYIKSTSEGESYEKYIRK